MKTSPAQILSHNLLEITTWNSPHDIHVNPTLLYAAPATAAFNQQLLYLLANEIGEPVDSLSSLADIAFTTLRACLSQQAAMTSQPAASQISKSLVVAFASSARTAAEFVGRSPYRIVLFSRFVNGILRSAEEFRHYAGVYLVYETAVILKSIKFAADKTAEQHKEIPIINPERMQQQNTV